MRSRVRSLIRAHPLTSFFLLTLVLSWWPWPLYATGHFPLPIASFGPFLAALLIVGLAEGRSGLRALVRSMLHWRVPVRWWLAFVTVPVVITLTALALNLLLGAQPPSATQLSAWTGVPLTFAAALLVPGAGGAWEEPGWRGYALPRLMDRYGWKAASLILGAVSAAWHLPLILSDQVSWWDLLLVVAYNIVIARLFLASGRSVLLVMVLHATNNAVSGGFVSQLFTGADASQQAAITALIWAAAAGVLLTIKGHRSRRLETTSAGRDSASSHSKDIG
ncbi:MAG TPA: type II CAAX endopeptidase family protein [Propionibacteriaceae bacterium]